MITVILVMLCALGFPHVDGGFMLTHNIPDNEPPNRLRLTCLENNMVPQQDFSFWLNDTTTILDSDNFQYGSVTRNTAVVDIIPMYEGTFFCGRIDGQNTDSSNGIGPVTGEENIILIMAVHAHKKKRIRHQGLLPALPCLFL